MLRRFQDLLTLTSAFLPTVFAIFFTAMLATHAHAVGLPQGITSFAGAQHQPDGSAVTADGFLRVSTDHPAGVQADEYGAFIDQNDPSEASSQTNYLEVSVHSGGSFRVINAVIGEYTVGEGSAQNDFQNVYAVGYLNGVQVAITNAHDSIGRYETDYALDFSSFAGLTLDTFRVYVTHPQSSQLVVFNLESIEIAGASLNEPPTVTAASYSALSSTNVTLSGEVTATGGQTVTERGFVLHTAPNPTTVHSKISVGSGTGSFQHTISDLSPATTYYARAYAVNSVGTGYGAEVSFTTQAAPVSVTTPFSGNLTTERTFIRPRLPGDTSELPEDYDATWGTADITAGTATYNYFAQLIKPAVAGPYSITVTGSQGLPTGDTMMFIYAYPFDPAQPLVNVLAGNDDVDSDWGNYLSRIDISLDAGVTYVLVLTSFNAGDQGQIDFVAVGPGDVEVSEEPVTPTPTAPSLAATALNPTFTENGPAVRLFGQVTAAVNDPDQHFNGLGLTVANVANLGEEALYIAGSRILLTNANSGLTASPVFPYAVSVSGTTATVSLTGFALDDAAMDTLIEDLSYEHLGSNPDAGERAITITHVSDDGASDNSATLALTSTVTLVSVNQAPTDITLSNATVSQSAGVTALVGMLSSTDSDSTTFLYHLVSGAGDTHNTAFVITGNQLHAINAAAMAAGDYEVRIRSTDDGGLSVEKALTVAVLDDVPPYVVSVSLDGSPASGAESVVYVLVFSEAVTGLGHSHVSLTSTGTANGDIDGIAGSGYEYFVTVGGITGAGTLRLDVATGYVDAASNVGTPYAGGATHTVDRESPAAPTLTLDPASDSGVSNSDGVTNATSLTFNGTAEADSSVELYVGNTVYVGHGKAGGTGNWSITIDNIPDGSYSFTASATDAALNMSALSAPVAVIVDTAAPVVLASAPAGATQDATTAAFLVSFSENVHGIDVADFTLTPVGSAAGTVSAVSESSGLQTTVTVSDITGSGTLRLDAVAGAFSDAAGNASPAFSTGTSHQVDRESPAAPTLALDPASDTGVSNSDGVTNDTTPSFSGTAEANSTVRLYANGTTELGSVSAGGDGTWSLTSATLTDGTYSITAKAADAAGNISAASDTVALVVDASAPALTASAPVGDAQTADAAVDFEVSAPETVYGADTSAFVLTNTGTAQGTISAVSPAAGDTFTIRVTNISGTGSLRLDSVGAGLTDVAGNVLPAFSGGLTHNVDRDAPVVDSLVFDQSVVFGGNQAAISATLAGAETGTTAHYSISGTSGSPVSGQAAVDSATQQITGLDVTALPDGVLTLSVILKDASGNESTPVTATIDKDVKAPVVSSVSIAPGVFVSGMQITFALTLDEDVVIDGGELSLGIDLGGVARTAAFTGESGGALSFAYVVQDGDNTGESGVGVKADGLSLGGGTVRDASGNDADLSFAALSSDLAIVDTEAPAVPGSPVLDAADDSGISASDGVTNVNQPTLSGEADPLSELTLISNHDGVIGELTVDGSGEWRLTLAAPLSDNVHEITAVAADAYGNASQPSLPLTLTIDTAAPTLSGVAFDVAAIDGLNYQGVSFTLAGAEVGSTAHYTLSDGTGTPLSGSVAVTLAAQQNGMLDVSALADGSVSVSVYVEDAAGNTSPPVANTITKNVNPVLQVPAALAPLVDGGSRVLSGMSVSGTLSSLIEVEVSVDAGALSSEALGGANVSGAGTGTLALSGSLTQINSALAGLTFTAPEDFSGEVTFEVSVDDGVGVASGSVNLKVYDRPQLQGLGGATVVHYVRGAPVALDADANAMVVDQDNPLHFAGGTLTVAVVAGATPAEDLLAFRTGGAVSLSPSTGELGSVVSVNDGTSTVAVGSLTQALGAGNALIISFDANLTPSRLALLLRSLTYANTALIPTRGDRTIGLTFNDGTYADANGSASVTVNVRFAPTSEPGGTVIDSNRPADGLSGTITVTESGILNGGSVTGTIINRGTITGELSLGGGSRITGGSITGSISGDANSPALLQGAHIASSAYLENVIIGEGTVLAPGVRLGPGVKFGSEAAIPAGMDLTDALRSLQWSVGDARSVVMLGDEVLSTGAGQSDMTIIRAIQLLSAYEPAGNTAEQDPYNGEIVIITPDSRSAVLPVEVSKAEADDVEGTYIDENGDIVFVTGTRRVVLAYPALGDSELFSDLLASFGLAMGFDSRANLVVTSTPSGGSDSASGAPFADRYFSARPGVSAVQVFDATEGLQYRPVPGLPNATQLAYVFRDEQGRLMEQSVTPVPANWLALKERLAQLPAASGVQIDTQGIISVTVGGTTLRGRMGYAVFQSDLAAEPFDQAVLLQPVGDANGDGTVDYNVLYPNGDVQLMLIFP